MHEISNANKVTSLLTLKIFRYTTTKSKTLLCDGMKQDYLSNNFRRECITL